MNLHDSLASAKTIAIIGLSDKPERASYQVASYLIDQGYTVLPVNPHITSVFGQDAYASLQDIPKNTRIDIVDIFRNSNEVLGIVREVINTGRAPLIWMQEDIRSPEAESLAHAHSLEVVSNTCIMKTHKKLFAV